MLLLATCRICLTLMEYLQYVISTNTYFLVFNKDCIIILHSFSSADTIHTNTRSSTFLSTSKHVWYSTSGMAGLNPMRCINVWSPRFKRYSVPSHSSFVLAHIHKLPDGLYSIFVSIENIHSLNFLSLSMYGDVINTNKRLRTNHGFKMGCGSSHECDLNHLVWGRVSFLSVFLLEAKSTFKCEVRY